VRKEVKEIPKRKWSEKGKERKSLLNGKDRPLTQGGNVLNIPVEEEKTYSRGG